MADNGHRQIQVGRAKKWQADTVDGPQVLDSEEEVFVLRWLEEAAAAGYVHSWRRCASRVIFDAVKGYREWTSSVRGAPRSEVRETVFLRERSYTPDFEFRLTPKFAADFLTAGDKQRCQKLAGVLAGPPPDDLMDGHDCIVCDVKGGYVLADRREEFGLKRHAMFLRYGVRVVEIDPAVLFALTWVPRAAAFTAKTGKRKTAFAGCRLLGEDRPAGCALPEVEL